MPKLQSAFMLSDKGYTNLKKAIFAVTLTNLALMLPFIVSIQIFMELIKPFTGGEISWNYMWLLFALGIISAGIVFISSKNDYKKTYVTSYLESENTRISISEHIRKLPMSVFNEKDLTDLTTNIMGDCATTEHVLSHILPQLIANFISITIVCIMLSFANWQMALAIFCSIPIAFLIIYFTRKIQESLGAKHTEAKLAVSGQVQEYIEGIKVIKACNLNGEKFSTLKTALRIMRNLAIKFEFITGIFVTGSQVIVQAGVGITIFLGCYLLINGKIEIISLFMFLLVVTRIYGPVLTILTLLPELLYNNIVIKRMRKLNEIQIMDGDATKEIDEFTIELEDISFNYNNDGNKAITGISTTIPAGGITALVGPSGSGKSTLSRLIARFWDVSSGKITIGGVDIKTLDPEHLMSYMSFVFQDVILFNDTVYNNILIGNRDATKEQVIAASKAACCETFIKNLPYGYDTVLGENGSTLSGGERQRISIARALLKDAPIVLLDEATASLDPENESFIQKAISTLIEGKTVIVIAHRLRTIAGADKIIVLDRGKLVEEGSHNDLIDRNGLYCKLYTIQQESLNWSV